MCLSWNDTPSKQDRTNAKIASTVRNAKSLDSKLSFNTATENSDLRYVLYSDKNESQLDRVYSVLLDRTLPVTLAEIAKLTLIKSESSVASRIRDIRERGFQIERSAHPKATAGSRIFTYKMV